MRPTPLALALSAVFAASVPGVALGQGAGALGSPWEPGRGPSRASPSGGATEGPQDIHAEDAVTGTPAAPRSGGAGVVVPEGYGHVVVPSPGSYPGTAPRLGVEDSLRLPSGIVTRLRALDADLQIIAARGGGSVLDGVLALAMGGLLVGLGVAIDEPVTGVPNPASPYLYTSGGGMIVRGILNLALMTNPGAVATTFAHMPMRTHREARERLRFGESNLSHLAEMAMISRYLDGGLSILLGLLIVPVYLVPNGFREDDAGSYLVLVSAAFSVTMGLITMFSVGEAERRWGAYDELRSRLAATPEGADDDAVLDELAEDDPRLATRTAGPSLHGRLGLGSFSLDGRF